MELLALAILIALFIAASNNKPIFSAGIVGAVVGCVALFAIAMNSKSKGLPCHKGGIFSAHAFYAMPKPFCKLKA